MQKLKTIEVDGVLENGELRYSATFPKDVSAQVKIIVVYNDEDNDLSLIELSREEFAQQFKEALANAGYDSNEKIAELVRDIKREQAKELGYL